MASADDALQNMIQNLEKKTGKTMNQWIKLARGSGKQKHGEVVKFLKTEHGLGHGYANLVTHKALETGSISSSEEDLVTGQYSGAKAGLRPIYDALIKEVNKFGKDVELSPKKAYVSLRRKKQFGIIQPSTATRVDVGINLKGEPAKGRLEASGSFNAMVSHRVRVADKKEVNQELVSWLRKAYEKA